MSRITFAPTYIPVSSPSYSSNGRQTPYHETQLEVKAREAFYVQPNINTGNAGKLLRTEEWIEESAIPSNGTSQSKKKGHQRRYRAPRPKFTPPPRFQTPQIKIHAVDAEQENLPIYGHPDEMDSSYLGDEPYLFYSTELSGSVHVPVSPAPTSAPTVPPTHHANNPFTFSVKRNTNPFRLSPQTGLVERNEKVETKVKPSYKTHVRRPSTPGTPGLDSIPELMREDEEDVDSD